MTDTLNLLEDLVARAKNMGADGVDAVAIDARSKSVSFRQGKLEDVDGSQSEDIGLRIIHGKRQAMTSTSNRTPDALTRLIERTNEMAKAAPEDPYCGLADKETLHTGPLADLDLYDETEISADKLGELAKEAEATALSVKGVTNSDGANAGTGSWSIALATSDGFARTYKGSSFSVSVSAIAGKDTEMERDYDFSSCRHAEDLEAPELVGRIAGQRAVARLGAKQLKSGQMPVVFAPRVAKTLVGHFVSAINGGSIARGSSFLKDHLGDLIFPETINIIDDPYRRRGLASRLFDGEGAGVNRSNLVDKGRLATWMLNSATARQLEMTPTGHASRGPGSPPGISGSNIYMEAGPLAPDALISEIKNGFYVTELIGMGVNGVTGDYSRGAAGFCIENGVLTHPVSEVTIAGNLKDMFKTACPASDLTFRYATNAPTIRIEGLTIAGA